MKFFAALGVALFFTALLGTGIVLAVAKGTAWLLLCGIALYLFLFVRFGCIEHH